jgi:predicted  nucleic acid-binding Zn-ribbon protein
MSERMRDGVVDSAAASPPQLNVRSLERIQRWLQYIAGFVLLIFIVSISISYFELRRIRREIADGQEQVRQQRKTIEENSKLLESQKQSITGLRTVVSGLQQATLAATEADPKQGEQTKETVEKILAQTEDTRQLPPRIYVQIAREDQRKHAAEVARQLQSRGYIVPENENVRGKAPTTSQLRFCSNDKTAEEDVAGITKTLQSISISVTSYRLPNCGNVRARHYEIWFGEEF